jgi:hypothetical protein
MAGPDESPGTVFAQLVITAEAEVTHADGTTE